MAATVVDAVRGPRNAVAEAAAAFFVGNMFANIILLLLIVAWCAQHASVRYGVVATVVAYLVQAGLSRAHVTGSWTMWSASQSLMHRLITNYFNTRLIVEEGMRPGEAYVLCFAPHAIHGFGLMTATDHDGVLLSRVAPFLKGRVVGLVARVLFWIPGVRELFLVNGYRDASAKVAEAALREGNSVALIIGGEAESLLSEPGTDKVVCDGRKRKGFVRLALKAGAKLVPVYMFRNTDTYSTSHVLFAARKWLSKRFQICLPIWWGRFMTPLPYQVDMLIVYGKPVEPPLAVTLNEKGVPTDECVDAYHQAFKTALNDMFERHKAVAGYPSSRKLEIVASN